MSSTAKFLVAGLGLALLGGIVLSGTAPSPTAPGTSPLASSAVPVIDWSTGVVDLEASSFEVAANGRSFTTHGTDPALHSDRGGPEYWTLEVDWTEHELEQRLYLYFASDGTDWWVDQIRTRDGYDPAEWIYAHGPFFRTKVGEAFEGDVSIDLLGDGRPRDEDNHVPGTLTIDDMRLAVSPRSLEDLAAIPPGGGIAADEDPFAKGGPLRCSAILQLPPAEAHDRLLQEGYRVSYRLDPYTGDDFDPTVPPAGVIAEYSVDSYGNLILFVIGETGEGAVARSLSDLPKALAQEIRSDLPSPKDCTKKDPTDRDRSTEQERSAAAEEEACGSEGQFATEDAETLCRAVDRAFGDPWAGAGCLSIEDARALVDEILAELGSDDGWSVTVDEYARDDGCAIANVQDEHIIDISTVVRPEVAEAIQGFRDFSLDECLDRATAMAELTTRLAEAGLDGYRLEFSSSVAGPNDRWFEIQAHARAGCVFYTLSGGDPDGTIVYYLHADG